MASAQRNTLRIIGGHWRGRKLRFHDIPDLRPTPDRVRETLFNWLQNEIVGARCLDLFTGSGALGLEALSRGAKFCLFIDAHHQVVSQIQDNLALLQPLLKPMVACAAPENRYQVLQANALDYVAQQPCAQAFDLVFIDPPFQMDCSITCCQLLEYHHWLRDDALIYLESPRAITATELPENWQLHRHKQAGNVHYHLVRRTKPGSPKTG